MAIFTDSDDTIPVEWFFCQDDAQVLPFPTRFGSGNWASSKLDWFGPGEKQGAARPYKKGQTIPRLDGTHFCGTINQFGEGASINDDHLCTDADGVSSCCVGESWCCDFEQLPTQITLPFTVLNVTNPIPSGFFNPTAPRFITKDLTTTFWFYRGYFNWPLDWPLQKPYITIRCDGTIMRYINDEFVGHVFPATYQQAHPVAIVWEEVAPFGILPPPWGDVRWRVLVGGSMPVLPPGPPYSGLFPSGYFPTGYAPVTF